MILTSVLFVLSCALLEVQGRAFYCFQEVRPGPCRGNFKRFFFNQTSGKCEPFIYGGCNGNLNRFRTLDECETDCHEGFQPKHCNVAPDSGPCKSVYKRYFYNNKTDTCEEFVFGGCGGNRNNFRRVEDCQHECKRQAASAVSSAVCVRPAFSGPCLAYIPRYHYDPATRTCKQFIYGGCQSNGNNFRSEEECLSSCSGVVDEAPSGELCSLPPETGMCRGFFPRYHYDPKSNTCRRFIYGGCGGNANNFKTEAECTNTCSDVVEEAPSGELCSLPPETGKCRGFFPRYHYDPKSNTCRRFIYGGCGGNANNFKTETECTNTCGGVALSEDDTPVCRRPPKTGNCRARISRFYFDYVTKTCKEFTYGGCDSNGNNFHNHEECMNACEHEIEVCHRPPKTGMCRGNFPMFYYDPKTRSCKEFIYGGCDSNGNNFGSVEECLNACNGPIWN